MLESYSATPMYQTQARIVIQDERSTAVANLNSTGPTYWQDPEPYFNTQYRILQSRGLARRVVRKLPPAPVPEPSTFSRVLSMPRQLINRWRKPAASAADRRTACPDESAAELAAIGEFLGGVEILPVKGTRLVEIAYTSPDPAVRRARCQHACARVRAGQPRSEAGEHDEHDQLARRRARQATAEGRSGRARDGRIPGGSERDVPQRGTEHRHRAAELAERGGDQGQDRPSSEGSGLPSAGQPHRRQRQRRHLPGGGAEPHHPGNQAAAR